MIIQFIIIKKKNNYLHKYEFKMNIKNKINQFTLTNYAKK